MGGVSNFSHERYSIDRVTELWDFLGDSSETLSIKVRKFPLDTQQENSEYHLQTPSTAYLPVSGETRLGTNPSLLTLVYQNEFKLHFAGDFDIDLLPYTLEGAKLKICQ